MRYVLIEDIRINNVVYLQGTECYKVDAKDVPKRYGFMKRVAERVESGMDQKHVVVLLDGEIRMLKRRHVEAPCPNSTSPETQI